jgi:hypothetical protein
VIHPTADATLRRLCRKQAATFGTRLLGRANGDAVSFQEFVAVARELISALPDQAAVYLAALVALDMNRPDDPDLPAMLRPSPN